MFNKKKLITKYDFERIQNIINSINDNEYVLSTKKLEEKLKKAKLVDSKEIKSSIITMNTKFRLRNLGNGSEKECILVFPNDSDPQNNKISIFENIGAELFSHEEGEIIYWANGEDAYYLIENILYQPEAAGDYHL
jgi:regulator of nucleoside diphosphate kinase